MHNPQDNWKIGTLNKYIWKSCRNLTSTYHLFKGKLYVIASQLRCTSKSVDRLNKKIYTTITYSLTSKEMYLVCSTKRLSISNFWIQRMYNALLYHHIYKWIKYVRTWCQTVGLERRHINTRVRHNNNFYTGLGDITVHYTTTDIFVINIL